jgi:3-isopropylmalate dehydrogenase
MARFRLLLLPGDGIGPEVMAETARVIAWFADRRGIDFDIAEDLVGGAAYDVHGTPLADATMAAAQAADAVLLGAVGGPKYDRLDFSVKPERGLLRLRKEMDLYANLRPAQCFAALADFSSLKRELVAGLDLVIVRELTSGIYFGEPRGIRTEGNQRVGINTQRYTEAEIARVARSAFGLARQRNNRVCSMEKANVMESGILWREVVQEVHDRDFPDVALSHMYADAGAMQLVRAPKQFDVIVTDNLFGDLLSDEAAMLTGSLGMLPSASLGAPSASGRPRALYEPVHGSAPDIAGQGKANPCACILSFAMALRYSFDLGDEADRLEAAVEAALDAGVRTPDLMQSAGGAPATTAGMGDAILAALEEQAGGRPVALAINKIDRTGKDALLPLAEDLNKARDFAATFFISAERGHGVDDLKRWLAERLPEGPWLYPEDQAADMPMRLLAAEITREKLTLRLHEELPYQLTVETEGWTEFRDGSVKIEQVVLVAREGHKGIALGKRGETIKAVGAAAREELTQLLGRKVHLFVSVRVRERWEQERERYEAMGLDFSDGGDG